MRLLFALIGGFVSTAAHGSNEAVIDASGQQQILQGADRNSMVLDIIQKSGTASPLTEDVARSVAEWIEKAKADPTMTRDLLSSSSSNLTELEVVGESVVVEEEELTEEDVIEGEETPESMIKQMSEMVAEMNDMGNFYGDSDPLEVIDDLAEQDFFADTERLAAYKANPQLFLEDYETELYTGFLSLAAELGYLEMEQ